MGCDWRLWGSKCDCRHPNPTRRIIFWASYEYELVVTVKLS
jgi:hypothetical protein